MSEADIRTKQILVAVLSVLALGLTLLLAIATMELANQKVQALINSRNYPWTPLEVKPTISSWDNLQPAVGQEWLR